ncbi:MAG: bifunctional riboflavin kinase/FAD synthetase [Ignavibacteriae bacterium]|nr:bifunctional riboflavin kinase/FAD synthetase [Ignavibacteriota bacterium]NOG96909.1 bifunctional riboflavin kinase/FAD synthetase [Ignavibacteriota bacterium]
MKIYTDNSDIKTDKDKVVTVGTFDGVHQGHLNIIDLLISKTEEINGESILITFDPHPRTVVSGGFKNQLLTTLDEKIELMEKFGVDEVFVINFTKEFAQTTYEEFIKKIIVDKVNAKYVVIGHDHKFGKDRNGNETKLRELAEKMNFEVSAVEAKKVDGEVVSSTKIRKALTEGRIKEANIFLGWNYYFSGKVIKGAKRGRLLGFPTANIKLLDENKVIPKSGVYAVKCSLNNQIIFGVMNIGNRPTFNDIDYIIIEVHLIDFNKFIYDEILKIEFVERIRDEQKFESRESLIEQITKDKNKAEEILSKLINPG